jgi:3-hydroxymyristoyl/3-hydroxydecanoyl-(acyl carrier protein) dehydratase
MLFSRDQIKAFTKGDHRVCFGDQFSGFGDRRFPRLPNGPLQFIDRVIRINGEAGKLRPGSAIVTEIDLPQGSWYQLDHSTHLPHVALMEIALQPCGFLSAYSGSIQGREDQDLYFRNLDGEGNLLFWPISSEPKITNKAKLISSSNLDKVIIQKYSFELFQGEDLFFQGNSSFGYFPLPMLQNQAGLDGNEPVSTWKKENPQSGNWQEVHSDQHANLDSQNPHLPRVEQLWIARLGGIHNQGYIFLEQEIPEDAWFYRAHFYQDPVMPGSLGVETMAQALMAASSTWNISSDLIWRIKPGSKLIWKYRGQITPDIRKINLEMHIKSVLRGPECWEICADGYLLKNDSRIYQIDNLCLEALAAD